MAQGILGNWELVSEVAQPVYVNNYLSASSVAVNVCNRNHLPAKISIAVSTSTTPSNTDYIEYETTVNGKGVLERSGILTGPGEYIIVKSSLPNVSVVLWGVEIGLLSGSPVTLTTNTSGVGPTWITPSELTVIAGDESSLQVSSGLPFILDNTLRSGYNVFIFKSGTGTFTPPSGVTSVEYLVAGGGGGGGYDAGGGGGAGGVLQGTLSVTAGTPYTISVGTGGAGSTNNQARPGTGSSFATKQASGGGFGGDGIDGSGSPTGGPGGSGGGGCGDSPGSVTYLGGAGISGQGFAGGSGFHSSGSNAGGGGGGGAGAVGANMPGTAPTSNPQAAGNGGIGVTTTVINAAIATAYSVGQVSSTLVYFGGGGGGGINNDGGNTGVAGTGGLGGGGAGARVGAGTAGTANTGGGGGAGCRGAGNGAAGGSGVVIIAYAI